MTLASGLVVPLRNSPLSGAPLRLAIFDASALTSDIIAATHRGRLSSFVAGMRDRTVRGFITPGVWAEVPRVLEDRWNEGGQFDLEAAQRLWWDTYIPVLHVACTGELP